MRCPVCGQPSLPPEPVGFSDARQRLAVSNNDTATPVSALAPDVPVILDGPRPAFTLRPSHTSPAHLIFTTGFVSSLVLAMLAFLDRKPMTTAIFGFLSIAFFLMLLRTPRKRVAPYGSWRSTRAEEEGDGGADHKNA